MPFYSGDAIGLKPGSSDLNSPARQLKRPQSSSDKKGGYSPDCSRSLPGPAWGKSSEFRVSLLPSYGLPGFRWKSSSEENAMGSPNAGQNMGNHTDASHPGTLSQCGLIPASDSKGNNHCLPQHLLLSLPPPISAGSDTGEASCSP